METVILIISIIIPILFLLFFIFKNTKYRTYCNNSYILVSLFLLSYLMFGLINFTQGKDNLTIIFDSLFNAIRMFTLSNGTDALGSLASHTEHTILIIYVDQLVCLLSVSLVLLTTLMKTFRARMNNFFNGIKALPYFLNLRNTNRTVKNVVYTDLPFDQIEEFLKKLKKMDGMILKVVVLYSSTKSERGEFLTDALKLNNYDVSNEYFSLQSLKKMIFAPNGKVNVYSLFYNDDDNIEFANMVLKLFKYKSVKRKAKNHLLNFYISYQDENFNSKLDYSRDSEGTIQLVNEYDANATKFIFYNPLSRILDLDSTDVNSLKAINNPPQLTIHFFGFGRIASSMLDKMFPCYQLPFKNNRVRYHIVSDDGETNLASYLSKFDSFSEVFNNSTYTSQRDFKDCFDGYNLDLNDEKSLREYLLNQVISTFKDNGQNMIFISLGDSYQNLALALKIRTIILNYASSFKLPLRENNFKKSILIYPYIKEDSSFQANLKCFGIFLDDINKDKPSRDDFVTYLNSKDKFTSGNKTFNFSNDYEASRLYIFDIKAESINFKDCFYNKNNYKTFVKKYNSEDRLQIFKNLREATFILEKAPIIPFGRGGYLRDDFYDRIRDLAAMENYSYLNKKNDNIKKQYQEALDIYSKELTYSFRISNIGSILSLPYKLGLFNYKLTFKDHIANKTLASTIIDMVDKVYKIKETLLKEIPSDTILKKDDLKKYFSNNFVSNIGETILYSEIEPLLNKLYSQEYLSFKKNIVTFRENYDPKKYDDYHLDLFNDLYAYLYQVVYIVNEEALTIRNIEHNRYYVLNAELGIIPLTKEEIASGLDKSKDKMRNAFMTSNEGLDEVARLRILARASRKIGNEVDIVSYSTYQDLMADCKSKNEHNPLFATYQKVYLNDIDSLSKIYDKLSIGFSQKTIYYLKDIG